MNGMLLVNSPFHGMLTDDEYQYIKQHADTGDDPRSLAHWQSSLQKGDFDGVNGGMYFDLLKLKRVADVVVAQPHKPIPQSVYSYELIPEYH